MTAGKEEIETWWDMPTGYPTRNFHTQNILRFTRNVEKATNERLRINVHPDGNLYAVPAILPAVESGKAQLGELIMANMAQTMPVLGIDSVPFIIDGYDDARTLWHLSRPLIQREFGRHNLVMLFAVPWPPQGLYINRPIGKIGDLRGLRLRSYDHATAYIAGQVGAIGVNVQASELTKAIAGGKIDAMWTSSATGVDIGAWNRFGFYYDINAWIPKNVVFMNKRVFESTSQTLQQEILEAAAEAEDRGWNTSQIKDRIFKDELASRGIEVVVPNQTLRDGLHTIGESLASQWQKLAGAEAGEAINEFKRKKTRRDS